MQGAAGHSFGRDATLKVMVATSIFSLPTVQLEDRLLSENQFLGHLLQERTVSARLSSCIPALHMRHRQAELGSSIPVTSSVQHACQELEQQVVELE